MTNKEAVSILKMVLADNPQLYADKKINEAFYMVCNSLSGKPTSTHYLTKEEKDKLFDLMRAYNVKSADMCRWIGCGYRDWELAINGERPFYKGGRRRLRSC